MPRRPATLALAALALATVAFAGTAAAPPASRAAEPLPACTTADDPAPFRDYPQWRSTFVDTQYRVARAYVPPNLVSTAKAGTNGGFQVRRLVIEDLRALVKAARRAGITIRVESAYRSFARQRDLYEHYVDLLG